MELYYPRPWSVWHQLALLLGDLSVREAHIAAPDAPLREPSKASKRSRPSKASEASKRSKRSSARRLLLA